MFLNRPQFIRTIRQCNREIEEQAESLLQGAASELKRGVINDTPVKTGAAKRAWEDNKPPQSLKIGDNYRLQNDVGYAIPLEFGTSLQAPQGMVRPNLVRVQAKYGGEIERR